MTQTRMSGDFLYLTTNEKSIVNDFRKLYFLIDSATT